MAKQFFSESEQQKIISAIQNDQGRSPTTAAGSTE